MLTSPMLISPTLTSRKQTASMLTSHPHQRLASTLTSHKRMADIFDWQSENESDDDVSVTLVR